MLCCYCAQLHAGKPVKISMILLMKVIVTGGFFPFSQMRNDAVYNFVESFSVISEACNMNEVIIVNKNRAFRGNRSVKVSEGELLSVASPNLTELIEINIKIELK